MPANSLLNSEFNDFLFAPIGEEKNTMLLSVISALARLGIDPWQEAARLAQLPKELAAQSLASMIGALPSGRWAPSDSGVIAARLVQRLPSRNNFKAVAANCGFRQINYWQPVRWLIYAVAWGVMLAAWSREPPSGIANTHTPLTSTAPSPKVPLQGAD